MKNISKLFLVLILVTSIMFPNFSSAADVFAANGDDLATTGAEIDIEEMPEESQFGDILDIPKGSSSDGDVDIIIKDPKGNNVFESESDDISDVDNITDEGSTYELTPQMTGKYSVRYAVYSDDEEATASTMSKTFTIDVKGQKPSFEFEDNSDIILPEITNFDYELTIPYPTVYDSQDEEVDFSTMEENLTVEGVEPDGDTNIDFDTKEIEGKDYYTFTPDSDSDVGVYTINYTYNDPNTGFNAHHTEEVLVDPNFDPSDMDHDVKVQGSMPDEGVLGNDVSLPELTVRDSNDGDRLIESYTDIQVESVDSGESYNVEDNKFTPMEEGDYNVTFDVYDFFALQNEEPIEEKEYTIENVEDSEDPEVQPVTEYSEDEIDNESYDFENAKHQIPTIIAKGSEVSLPAIHAVDNYNDSSDITYTRQIKKGSSIEETFDGQPHQKVDYTFEDEDDYKVEYIAEDQNGNEAIVDYNVEVSSNFSDTQEPNISMPTIKNYVDLEETIEFDKPEVIDFESEDSDTVVDKRPLTEVYYYEGDDDSELTEIELNDDDKYEFIVPDSITEETITIMVRATDYHNNEAVETKEINIMDIQDTQNPYFVGSEPTIEPVGQNEVMDIPEITIADDNASFMKTEVDVFNPNDEKITVKDQKSTYSSDVDSGTAGYTMGGEYTTTIPGEYSIVFTATDPAGNVFVKSYMQYVNDTMEPTFDVSSIPNNVELGETITLPEPEIVDNGEEIENEAENQVEFVSTAGSYTFIRETFEFTAKEEGEYSFRYLAEDEFENEHESALFSFTVEDTTDPEIDKDAASIPKTSSIDQSLDIPVYPVSDSLNGIKSYSIKVENPDGTEILSEEGMSEEFHTIDSEYMDKNGSYTVTYTAVDLAGNETEHTETVRVGDTLPPNIELNNKDRNEPDTFNVGESLNLDFDSIVLDDNETEYDENVIDEDDFSVQLTDPEGEKTDIIDSEGSYDFELAGEYTLEYKVLDDAGNEETREVVIQAVEEEVPTSIITSQRLVIGLIAASLIILAGVVVYFIRSREFLSMNFDESDKDDKDNK
ncbi:MAG: hypothetical protein ACOCRO_02745 [Halanaerobiales bacterium]